MSKNTNLYPQSSIKEHELAEKTKESFNKRCLPCKGTGFITYIGWAGNDMSQGVEQQTSFCGSCSGTGFENPKGGKK
jgi:DnaJ-class molecular chaperone